MTATQPSGSHLHNINEMLVNASIAKRKLLLLLLLCSQVSQCLVWTGTLVLAELTDKIRKRYEHAIRIRIQWLPFALLNFSLPITEGYKPSHDI